jgi:hypothetical protein
VSEIAKTSLFGVSLAWLIGKSYDLGGFRSTVEVLGQKIRASYADWMHSAEVDALFRGGIVCGWGFGRSPEVFRAKIRA